MSAETEPRIKRTKVDNNDSLISETIDGYINKLADVKTLHPVLSDDLCQPIPLTKVYVGHVRNPKDLSRVLLTLNEKIPLKELQHLKRVRKKEVILCPSSLLNGVPSIQDYLECNVEELKDVFEYFKEVDVPLTAPKVRKQYNSQMWSCNFHPNKYYEKLVGGNFFSIEEIEIHTTFMQMAFETVHWYLERDNSVTISTNLFTHINAAIVVDPLISSVVAVSFCNGSHPVQHAAMLAIDNVAKTQNGGVWGSVITHNVTNCVLNGIEEELVPYLQQKFYTSKFGARTFNSTRNTSESGNTESTSGNTEGPYLCTGYYVYMLREPCVMCAMALVHARMKRVFFCFDNLELGALKSRTKLQTVSSLNHHFEVFTGFL